MASIEIRPAKRSDIPAIFRVRTSVVVNLLTEAEMETIGITRQSVERMLEAGEANAWCVDVGSEVVGFSLAFRNEREISALFVLPDYERRGFGSALLDEAVAWLEGHNSEPIRLVTDRETPAYRFYEGTVRAHPLQKSGHILYTFSFPVILPVCRSIRPRIVL